MQQTHLQVRKDLLLKPAVLINSRTQIQLFGLLHQRQHHIGLTAFVDLLADQRISLGPLAELNTAVLIGWRPGGNASIWLTSKSPWIESARVRGIGVAVIVSKWGCKPLLSKRLR